MAETLQKCTHEEARKFVEESESEFFHSIMLGAVPKLVLPIGFADFTKEALLLLMDYLKKICPEAEDVIRSTPCEDGGTILTYRFSHGLGMMVLTHCPNCKGKLINRPLEANKFLSLIRGEHMERILSDD